MLGKVHLFDPTTALALLHLHRQLLFPTLISDNDSVPTLSFLLQPSICCTYSFAIKKVTRMCKNKMHLLELTAPHTAARALSRETPFVCS